MFWEVVGLERGPLSLVRIIQELLEYKSSGFGSRKSSLTAVGTSSILKFGTNFADKRRSLGQYSLLLEFFLVS
jgi:hypothetical protein